MFNSGFSKTAAPGILSKGVINAAKNTNKIVKTPVPKKLRAQAAAVPKPTPQVPQPSAGAAVVRGATRAASSVAEGQQLAKDVSKGTVGLKNKVKTFLKDRRERVGKYLGGIGKGVQEGAAEANAAAPKKPLPGSPEYQALSPEKQRAARRAARPVGTGLSEEQAKKFKRQERKGEQLQAKHNPDMTGRYKMDKRERKGTPFVLKNRKRVEQRLKRFQDHKKGKDTGPSFMSKHPLLTLGAGGVAGSYLFGGKKEESPQPQMIYPQY